MKLTGLHLLLTYECTFECDHCFVWGGPKQTGTMSISDIRRILRQAEELETVEWIYFEGGEPFLYYPVLLAGVRMAKSHGFWVGIVTNSYWATSKGDAVEWLRPFAGLVGDLSVSSDLYHGDEKLSRNAGNAHAAAVKLEIPHGVICVAQPEETQSPSVVGKLPQGESAVMYRGRAAEKLAGRTLKKRWSQFTSCPHENLREPSRVHIDPLGEVHLCQGLSMGNLFRQPLAKMCEAYAPENHPVVGPLLEGGPAKLVKVYGLPHLEGYADACHLCYEMRLVLRNRFPEVLTPDQMYGVTG